MPTALRTGSRTVRGATALTITVALALLVNWLFQVARKPSELLFPVSAVWAKTPAETWRRYGAEFREYSTAAIPAELLAALAQSEGAGNPVPRTYWRWSWSAAPFEVYRPASSSVGMYQMTDGTFAEARTLCIVDHRAGRAGAHGPAGACRFNALYSRVVPSHAIEMTSAYLDRHVTLSLLHHRAAPASRRQKQHLAALIHLCGAGVGDLYVRDAFRLPTAMHCGAHDPRAYLAQVDALEAAFSAAAARTRSADKD